VGYRTDLLTGIAELLDAAGAARWSAAGAYAPGDLPVVTVGSVPATPDRVVTLTGYGVSDDPHLADTTTGVQVRCRWSGADLRPVDDLADAIFDVLHALGPVTLSTGVRVVSVHRQSSAPLGQDGNQRWSRVDNYYVTAHRPSPHRL
jgi:hypothetical protein